ncbi:MAG: hypothetical protein CMB59_01440 [Euryarchaeota archaeon]|nr:hypothetical protein [Euryarchaeota archaeon]
MEDLIALVFGLAILFVVGYIIIQVLVWIYEVGVAIGEWLADIFTWIWDAFVWILTQLWYLLEWLFVGVIINLVIWAFVTAIAAIPIALFYLFIKFAAEQIESSQEGRTSGTPWYILFSIPVIFVIGLPLVAGGMFLFVIASEKMLITLNPFDNWGDKGLGQYDNLTDTWQATFFELGDSYASSLFFELAPLFLVSVILIAISTYIIFQQSETVEVGVTSRYGVIGFGLGFILALFPVIQMFMWESYTFDLTENEIWKARGMHYFSCALSLIIVTIAMSKIVQYQQTKLNQKRMINTPYVVEIQEFLPGLYFKYIIFGLAAVISCYTFWLPISGDRLDGGGISTLNISLFSLLSVGFFLLGLMAVTIYLIRAQYTTGRGSNSG